LLLGAIWQGGHAHVHGKNVLGGRKVMDTQHFTYYKQTQQRINEDADILASIRNNGDVASAENVHYQINNNDNHHVADDPQPVGVPPDGRQCLLPQPLPMRRPQTLSEQQSAAREEPGVR
jgi:hypothetical protein